MNDGEIILKKYIFFCRYTDDTHTSLMNHIPTCTAGQAHMEAVHADWKEYLNLLICEENHLKHMEEYHKVDTRADVALNSNTHTHNDLSTVVRTHIDTFPGCFPTTTIVTDCLTFP